MSDLRQTYGELKLHRHWESINGTTANRKFNDDVMKRLLSVVRPNPGSVFLDAGCGFGDHTRRIAEAGLLGVGVDISQGAIEIARSRTNDQRASFSCGAIEALSFPDESFDYVHCRGVLMHIPRMKDSIKELVRVLRRGGKIVIMDSNSRALETVLIRVVRKFRSGASRMRENETGLEFWSTIDGNPFLVRYPHTRYIRSCLEESDVRIDRIFSYELFDVGRFPKGLRALVSAVNRVAFACRAPAVTSHGIVIIGTKASTRIV